MRMTGFVKKSYRKQELTLHKPQKVNVKLRRKPVSILEKNIRKIITSFMIIDDDFHVVIYKSLLKTYVLEILDNIESEFIS